MSAGSRDSLKDSENEWGTVFIRGDPDGEELGGTDTGGLLKCSEQPTLAGKRLRIPSKST